MTGNRNVKYQPLFPYFGGKSSVADIIWQRLGADVLNYVEPFAGSAAVLMLRPGGAGQIETINDADGFVSNAWRSIKRDPDTVAMYADEMVSECEIHARHLWLVGQRESLTDRLCGDLEFYDPKAAGFWVYGQCCWIGSGWCSGNGPWQSIDGEMVLRNPGQGVNRQLPHLGNPGQGVNRQLPHLRNPGQGVNRKLPHLGNPGQGVNRKLPHLGNPGKGGDEETPALGQPGPGCQQATPIDAHEDRSRWLRSYLADFATRLRHVRVCCGDWSRVCGPSVTFRHGMTGVFLDPPYADTATRTKGLYATDCDRVAHAVREWAIKQGSNPLMRICLAGYEGEHEMPADWCVESWEAVGGYGLIADDEEATGRANKGRERLWFSPACLRPERETQLQMFG